MKINVFKVQGKRGINLWTLPPWARLFNWKSLATSVFLILLTNQKPSKGKNIIISQFQEIVCCLQTNRFYTKSFQLLTIVWLTELLILFSNGLLRRGKYIYLTFISFQNRTTRRTWRSCSTALISTVMALSVCRKWSHSWRASLTTSP